MIHLLPIPEHHANNQVKSVYLDIKHTLSTATVPLFFQYLANYEDVLTYLWQKMRDHFSSKQLQEAVESIIAQSLKTVISLYEPTHLLLSEIQLMDASEKETKVQEVYKLFQTQAKMLLVEIQLREAIKGMPVIPDHARLYLEASKNRAGQGSEASELVNNQSLAVLNNYEYDSFFQKIEDEMKNIVTTKEYLEERVLFEKNVQYLLLRGAFPLEISYNQFQGFLHGKSFVDEMIFLLKDIFPSNAPRQVYTAALMNYMLNMD